MYPMLLPPRQFRATSPPPYYPTLATRPITRAVSSVTRLPVTQLYPRPTFPAVVTQVQPQVIPQVTRIPVPVPVQVPVPVPVQVPAPQPEVMPAPPPQVVTEVVRETVPVEVPVEVVEEVEVAPIVNQNVTLIQPRPEPSLTVVPYPREWYYCEMPKPKPKAKAQQRMMSMTVKTIITRVAHGDDDCEQKISTGKTSLHDDDLDLREGRLVGIRFQNVMIKPKQPIREASIDFHSKLDKMDNCQVDIWGHSAADSAHFAHDIGCLSSRPPTHAHVHWSIPPWVPGSKHTTPDLGPIVQEIVNHPDWKEGNSISFIFSGTSGHRSAWAFDGNPSLSPVLQVKAVEQAAHEIGNLERQDSEVPGHNGSPHGLRPGLSFHGPGPDAHDGYDSLGFSRHPDHQGDPWNLPHYAHDDQRHQDPPHHNQTAHLIYEDKFRYPRYNLSHEHLRPTRLEKQIPESSRHILEEEARRQQERLALERQQHEAAHHPPLSMRQPSVTLPHNPAAIALDLQDGVLDGKYFGHRILDSGVPPSIGATSTAAMALDAADGLMDGKYFGQRILQQSVTPSVHPTVSAPNAAAAYQLDAADGVIDGKYFGHPIVQQGATSTVSAPSAAAAYQLDAADGMIDGRYFGHPIVQQGGVLSIPPNAGALNATAAYQLDAADGVMDGKYYGMPIVQQSIPPSTGALNATAAYQLDAADGVIDGKYFGMPIVQQSVIASSHAPSASAFSGQYHGQTSLQPGPLSPPITAPY